MTIQTRRAKPDEAAVLTELSIRSKQSNGYDDAFMDACRQELTVTGEHLSSRAYWVAEAGTICGVVGLAVDEDGLSGEVCSLFVDPKWKRKGVGRLLWQTLVKHAKSKGLTSLRLDADPAAVPFYETLGLKIVGQVPSGSIEGRSLPHMMFELN